MWQLRLFEGGKLVLEAGPKFAMAQTSQFFDSDYLPVQLLSDKKMSLLIFAYGHLICRVKRRGGPNLAIKKPDARARPMSGA